MIEYSISKETSTDILVLPFFKEQLELPQSSIFSGKIREHVSQVLNSDDFEGSALESELVFTQLDDTPRVLLLGLGEQGELTIRNWKQSFGQAINQIQDRELDSLNFLLTEHNTPDFSIKKVIKETVTAISTANYAFDKYKDEEDKTHRIKRVNFVSQFEQSANQLERVIQKAKYISRGVNLTRDLGNTPPSTMTPTLLAEHAEKIGKETDKLEVEILSQSEIEDLGMGCFLGVAKGSDMAPKFIIMEYSGGGDKENPTVLAGKGITFDSGGLSLKPSKHMTDMKFDMLGAGTVLGVMQALAKLESKQNITAIIPSCENMPGSKAYRPDDVLESMNGKTVEIGNTDAEGRLTLADAFNYINENYNPEELIDFATLTGACMVALGKQRSGIFGSEDRYVEKFINSGEQVGEQLWRLPLGEEYSEAMKSPIADISNFSDQKWAGASTAAAFLQFFVEDDEYPWLHIDLSSSYYGKKGKPWAGPGANGFGVQTTVEYLMS